ncbi:MAG: nucleotidyltransferase domain-containing protein [Bacillota bacterium]
MNSLIRVELTLILEKLIPVLKAQEIVVGAYLFGSILGPCRQDSDIDVGLILKPQISYADKELEIIQARILEKLSPLNNHPFDLVILNRVNAIFAYRVISQGRQIYNIDGDAVTDFIEIICRQRAENYPRYCEALETIVKG